jgi:hypothetical protein
MQIEKLGFPLSTLFQGKRMGLLCRSPRWRCGSRMGVKERATTGCALLSQRWRFYGGLGSLQIMGRVGGLGLGKDGGGNDKKGSGKVPCSKREGGWPV